MERACNTPRASRHHASRSHDTKAPRQRLVLTGALADVARFARLSRRSLIATGLAAGMIGVALGSLAAADDRVLKVVSPWEYTSTDPTDTGFILARLQIAETLVSVEPDGRLVGLVAESWTTDPDRLTWRFKIRPQLTFHDNSPVTADAVAASLKNAFAGESLSNVPIERVAVDGNTVVITTKTPFGPLPAFLADYAGVILAPASYGADGKVQKIVATGPYRITGIDGKTVLDLEGFNDHWSRKPAIARVRYTAVPNGETRANIAVAGDADLVFTLGAQATSRINSAGQARVDSIIIPRLRFITLDLGLPQFEDSRVRRAMSLGLDRKGIASAILRHSPSMATQLLPPVLMDWHNKKLAPLETNIAAAKALLDEAGWRPGPTGIREKEGVRLSAKMLTMSNRPELPVMAAAIQAQMKAIGIDLTIEVGQASAVPDAIRDRTLQSALVARTYVNVPEPIASVIADYTRERSAWGTVNWKDRDRMKVLTDEYLASFDETRKAAIRAAITRMIHEEMPVIPVSYFEHTVAISNRITGVVIDPFELRYFIDRVSWK